MIIPTVASISKEVISAVPNSIREGAYSIGATKWEVIRHWVVSYGRSGIFGAVILGLGRAVGETMAVAMLIGNQTGPAAMPTSLFQPSQTMASLIANGFLEATGSLQVSAYIGVGLILLIVSLLINIGAGILGTSSSQGQGRRNRIIQSYRFRKFKNRLFFVLCAVCVVVAVTPLLSILWEVIVTRGTAT